MRYIRGARYNNDLYVLVIGSRPFFLRIGFLFKSGAFLRDLLPSFWLVGLRSCDDPHYGRVYYWDKFFAINGWHFERIERACNSSSDGPASFSKVSFIDWIKFKPRRMRSY
jgi:hypothetical protein